MVQKIYTGEVIAGFATAPGNAGISIIRISGENVWEIVTPLFRPARKKTLFPQSHRLVYGWIYDQENVVVDEVLLSYMAGPKSYTGENVIEINAHGGQYVGRQILELVLKQGARQANRGEFTRRAFLNGRIDLTQAEAVSDIVQAQTASGSKQAVEQLQGKLHRKINSLKQPLVWVLSLLNASLDFADEDVEFTDRESIRRQLNDVREELESMLATANTGIIIREGFRVALVGEPNTGKSSLLNQLLRKNRAIVTDIPGTTRDTLEESVDMHGLSVNLIDTAGIRETDNLVEKEGVKRALDIVNSCDLALWVIDSSRPRFSRDLIDVLPGKPTLIVANKNDLGSLEKEKIPEDQRSLPMISCCALKNEDVTLVEDAIFNISGVLFGNKGEGVFLTNHRQKNAARICLEKIDQALLTHDSKIGDEFLCLDLQQSLDALRDIVGETTPEDLLDQIFSNFCLGK